MNDNFSILPTEIQKSLTNKAKKKILVELWPQKWVKSSRLLELTNQKYFDRRIRELRDELGFQIESRYVDGEAAYRLVSHDYQFLKRRQYPTQKQKELLIKKYGFKCNICGLVSEKGKNDLNYDHRIPLNRGGEAEIDNLQLLCTRCNNMKRRECQACTKKSCNECQYAFPEKFDSLRLISLTREMEETLQNIAYSKNMTVEELILMDLEKFTENYN